MNLATFPIIKTNHCSFLTMCKVNGFVSAPTVVFYRQLVVDAYAGPLLQLCPLCVAQEQDDLVNVFSAVVNKFL